MSRGSMGNHRTLRLVVLFGVTISCLFYFPVHASVVLCSAFLKRETQVWKVLMTRAVTSSHSTDPHSLLLLFRIGGFDVHTFCLLVFLSPYSYSHHVCGICATCRALCFVHWCRCDSCYDVLVPLSWSKRSNAHRPVERSSITSLSLNPSPLCQRAKCPRTLRPQL